MIIAPGSTDVSVMVRIVDATDKTPETGVTAASAGLSLTYWRQGAAAAVGLTEVDLTAPDDAHADGGLLHLGAGYYRLDLPDAAFLAGADFVQVYGSVTGMIVEGLHIQLESAAAAILAAALAALADYNVISVTDPVPQNVTQWNGQPVPALRAITCWHKEA